MDPVFHIMKMQADLYRRVMMFIKGSCLRFETGGDVVTAGVCSLHSIHSRKPTMFSNSDPNNHTETTLVTVLFGQ